MSLEKNPLLDQFLTEYRAYHDPVIFAEKCLNFKLFPKQAEVLRKFYAEDGNKYRELVAVCGMRSGKTVLGAVISLYEAAKLIMLGNPQKFYKLMPGQDIYIMHVATSKDQSRDTIFAATQALIENSPWFDNVYYKTTYNEMYFPDVKVHVRTEHSNSASLAGRTCKAVVLDETARFKDNKGKFSGEAVYYTVTRATASFGMQGKIVSISSPLFDNDFQMQLYKKSKKVPTMLGIRLATWEMNPTIPKSFFEQERAKNPETFDRDYGAIPPKVFEAYFREPEKIDKMMVLKNGYQNGRIEQGLGNPAFKYIAAGDPAMKNDSFGLAVGHAHNGNVYIDAAFSIKPHGHEIDANEVLQIITALKSEFPFRTFITDVWYYPETLQKLRSLGVRIKQRTVTKREYDSVKELIYNQKLYLPESELLSEEMKNLQLVRGTKVDHPRDGSKDIADAVANVVYELVLEGEVRPIAAVADMTAPVTKDFGIPHVSIDLLEREAHEVEDVFDW